MKKRNFLLFLLLALPWSLPAQDLSTIIDQAEALTDLLESIGQANSEQQRQLQSLNELLTNSENELTISKQAIADLKKISETQGEYVNRLLEEAKKQQAIYEAQLSYQKRLQLRSKILTVSLIAAVPAVAALGIWAGIEMAR